MVEMSQEQVDKLEKAADLLIKELGARLNIDDQVNLSAGTGTNDLKFANVRQNEVLVLQHLSGYDDTSSPTRARVGYWNGHRLNWLKTVPAPLVSETVEFNGWAELTEGMYPIVRFEGATSGDDLYATLNGYIKKTK